MGEPRTGLSITILEHLVSYFLTPPCLLHSCGGFFYLDLIFNPNYSSGMIDPSKVNICIELDRISILGNDWIFCYIDNKKEGVFEIWKKEFKNYYDNNENKYNLRKRKK